MLIDVNFDRKEVFADVEGTEEELVLFCKMFPAFFNRHARNLSASEAPPENLESKTKPSTAPESKQKAEISETPKYSPVELLKLLKKLKIADLKTTSLLVAYCNLRESGKKYYWAHQINDWFGQCGLKSFLGDPLAAEHFWGRSPGFRFSITEDSAKNKEKLLTDHPEIRDMILGVPAVDTAVDAAEETIRWSEEEILYILRHGEYRSDLLAWRCPNLNFAPYPHGAHVGRENAIWMLKHNNLRLE